LGQALIVALKLRDPSARLSLENITLAQPNAIRLDLGGDTIRSIEYDGILNVFQIISGEPENKESKKKKPDFTNHGAHGGPRGKENEKSLLYLTYPRDPRVPRGCSLRTHN
jgi:hypothetical protein